MVSFLFAEFPARCRRVRTLKPDRSERCLSAPKYECPRAGVRCRARQHLRYIQVSRNSLVRGSGGEIIDFCWLYFLQDADEVGSIREITIVQKKARPW